MAAAQRTEIVQGSNLKFCTMCIHQQPDLAKDVTDDLTEESNYRYGFITQH